MALNEKRLKEKINIILHGNGGDELRKHSNQFQYSHLDLTEMVKMATVLRKISEVHPLRRYLTGIRYKGFKFYYFFVFL